MGLYLLLGEKLNKISLPLGLPVQTEFPPLNSKLSVKLHFKPHFMQPEFHILVVDDDPMLLDILNRSSRDSFPEASFIQVYSASEAITYINELDTYGPKLILLDINLGPSLNGFDFLAFLRNHAEGRYLPIVMLTVDQLSTTIDSAYSVGASSYTVKPSSFEGWKTYFATLRLYWFTTVTIPPVRFRKLDPWK